MADDFRFSMRVWGITPVNAEIYLKDRTEPLTRAAQFRAEELEQPIYYSE
jgi:hypothetical protein